ncbi:helix-turn-helix and ligand-binding sensor domain-containing protein [Psychroflexus montanilacus]|uniref:helix-turn-helix and ligand-binding sensor domain-containing protein n=1 Tax=Psychroflexus montanilacus TaxID=2873598 RepID=UPI001CCE5446|nr:triple tyrosine motif-containing protein [Psychroflexus montanilacus]MBZ9651704.1 Y Y Y domain-containing protein [Psychroflexus montanilacus]
MKNLRTYGINYSKWLIVNILFALSFSLSSIAQELPPVLNFSTEDYNADNQNWSITQTQNKDLFFANSKGLLRFDGERWTLLGSPNKTILRSVFADDDKIYSGAYMDFGVWEKKGQNDYEYKSLSQDLELIEDEQFWKIDKLNQLIAFQSLNSIYLFDATSESFKVIESEFGIHKMVIIDNILYYHKIKEGVFKLVNGREEPVNTSEIIKNSLVINIYQIDNSFYAQTQYNGIINLKDNSSYSPKDTFDNWSDISVYNSIQTENGDIYLGTISHGLLKLSNNKIDFHLNQENTLSNNTVLNLFQDIDNHIWLGLDNGINCVNTSSKISIYNDGNGDLGTVYSSIKHNDTIYLGTNQGLFYRGEDSKTLNYIKGTKGQVWSLFKHENQLFCGHNSGTFLINGTDANLISDVQGTWLFKSVDDETILSGNYNGLHKYKKSSSGWVYDQKLKGFNISTKYFEFINPQEILVNHEYKGIYKLELNDSLTQVNSVEKDFSVPKGLYSSIIKYQDKILYAYKNGIFNYNEEQNKFEKDSTLSSLYADGEYSSGRLVKTEDGKVWAFAKSDIIQLLPSSLQEGYVFKKIPINHKTRHQLSGYENVSLLAPNTYLLGSSNGYLKLDLNNYTPPRSKVKLKDVIVSTKDGKFVSKADSENNEFANKNNYIDFLFTSNNYKSIYKSEYQYKLENYNSIWSDWNSLSKVSFENLPYGEYTFKVRSRNGTQNVSEIVDYDFVISKPFYLSNKMILFYAVILLIVGFFVHSVYRQYYKKQNRQLQEKANKELEFRELEAQRKIMRIKNEQLEQDIENKNRELAISTMSIIKKNEFLAGIKNDLKEVKAKEDRKLDKVLKTINKNLNNSDDWSFFEEAFNNADKDFLKKIKSKHPSLTPNDLRLCAYLRLNLSSKEIAPLFNISIKSVEVKRYRLRKKMDLPREKGLTDYILEI